MQHIYVTPIDTNVPTPLAELARGRPVVLDLWRTRCPACPAAIANLAAKARMYPHILFVAANLDSVHHAELMADSGMNGVEHLTHVYMDEATKDSLKGFLKFTRVPYCIIFRPDSKVLAHGLAFEIDYDAELSNFR